MHRHLLKMGAQSHPASYKKMEMSAGFLSHFYGVFFILALMKKTSRKEKPIVSTNIFNIRMNRKGRNSKSRLSKELLLTSRCLRWQFFY